MLRIESKEYKGHEYDSFDEALFARWLDEAVKAGYVLAWKPHPKTYLLISNVKRRYFVKGKTAKKPWLGREESMFSRSTSYTPDFIIWWAKKAFNGSLVGRLEAENDSDMITDRISGFEFMSQLYNGHYYSMPDVKSQTFGQHSSHKEFGIKSKLMWEKHGVYIQKTIVINQKPKSNCLFSRTWAPKEYLEQDRKDGKGYYAVNCERKYLEDYDR